MNASRWLVLLVLAGGLLLFLDRNRPAPRVRQAEVGQPELAGATTAFEPQEIASAEQAPAPATREVATPAGLPMVLELEHPVLVDRVSGEPVPHARVTVEGEGFRTRLLTDCAGRLPLSTLEWRAVRTISADEPTLASALRTAERTEAGLALELPPFVHVHLSARESLHRDRFAAELISERGVRLPLKHGGAGLDRALLYPGGRLPAGFDASAWRLELADADRAWFATAALPQEWPSSRDAVNAEVRRGSELLVTVRTDSVPSIKEFVRVELHEIAIPIRFDPEQALRTEPRVETLHLEAEETVLPFAGLDAGRYRLTASHPSFHSGEIEFDLTWGDSQHHEIEIRPLDSIPTRVEVRNLSADAPQVNFHLVLESRGPDQERWSRYRFNEDFPVHIQQRPVWLGTRREEWLHLPPRLHRVRVEPGFAQATLFDVDAANLQQEFFPPGDVRLVFDNTQLEWVRFQVESDPFPPWRLASVRILSEGEQVASARVSSPAPAGGPDRDPPLVQARDWPYLAPIDADLEWRVTGFDGEPWARGRLQDAPIELVDDRRERVVRITPPPELVLEWLRSEPAQPGELERLQEFLEDRARGLESEQR